MLSSGHIPDAKISIDLCKRSPDYYTTIGCHPCRATEAADDCEAYQKQIEEIIDSCEDKSRIVAIGECGLDYDRFNYADKET